MDTSTEVAIVEEIIGPAAQSIARGFIAIEKLKQPDATADELVSAVDGDVKHYLRAKIGFGVDILWAFPQFREPLDAVIRETLPPVSVAEPAPAPIEAAPETAPNEGA